MSPFDDGPTFVTFASGRENSVLRSTPRAAPGDIIDQEGRLLSKGSPTVPMQEAPSQSKAWNMAARAVLASLREFETMADRICATSRDPTASVEDDPFITSSISVSYREGADFALLAAHTRGATLIVLRVRSSINEVRASNTLMLDQEDRAR